MLQNVPEGAGAGARPLAQCPPKVPEELLWEFPPSHGFYEFPKFFPDIAAPQNPLTAPSLWLQAPGVLGPVEEWGAE